MDKHCWGRGWCAPVEPFLEKAALFTVWVSLSFSSHRQRLRERLPEIEAVVRTVPE